MSEAETWNNYIKTIRTKINRSNKISPSPKKIRNTNPPISAKNSNLYSLDLHGHTVESAFSFLKSNLEAAFKNNLKSITIITGKGSINNPSVLKLEVPRWLQYTELNKYIAKFNITKNNLGEEQGLIIATLRKNKGDRKYE